ncbi:MAG: type II secretion system protein [bacterium]
MKKIPAFTLIEMMVVIILVGIMATIVIPRLYWRKPQTEWQNVLDDLNNMVFFARQEAVSDKKIYRLLFKSNQNEPDFIIVQEEGIDEENPTKKIYEQVRSYYFDTKYEFDESIKMVAFYSGGKEMFEENKNVGYCYVVPDGLVQDVMIRMIRRKDEKESKVSFKMMPFQGEFVMYEGFLKPEK